MPDRFIWLGRADAFPGLCRLRGRARRFLRKGACPLPVGIRNRGILRRYWGGAYSAPARGAIVPKLGVAGYVPGKGAGAVPVCRDFRRGVCRTSRRGDRAGHARNRPRMTAYRTCQYTRRRPGVGWMRAAFCGIVALPGAPAGAGETGRARPPLRRWARPAKARIKTQRARRACARAGW